MTNLKLLQYAGILALLVLFLINTELSSAQECTSDSQCRITGECITEYGGKTYNRCVKCKTDSHCSGSLSKCKVNSNPVLSKCVECVKEYDCGSGKHCVDNMCYVCTNDSHCSGQYGACLRNRSVQEGRCVECTTNSHCTLNQMCDTSTYTCKAKYQAPEPEIDPDKYPSKYKGKSPKKLQTAPEIQKNQIDLEKASPKKSIPKK